MKKLKLLSLLIIVILLNGCYTYSSYQSAKLLVKNKYEITPNYSSVSFSDNGESEKLSDNFGIQLGYGLTDDINIRFRYENISPDFNGVNSHNFLAIEPKFSLLQDRTAFSFPIGIFTGENVDDSKSVQIHPSIHLTFPIVDYIELNLSPKALIFLDEDAHSFLAVNAGLGIITNSDKFIIRPEIGFLWDIDSEDIFEGNYFSWGIGLSFMP